MHVGPNSRVQADKPHAEHDTGDKTIQCGRRNDILKLWLCIVGLGLISTVCCDCVLCAVCCVLCAVCCVLCAVCCDCVLCAMCCDCVL